MAKVFYIRILLKLLKSTIYWQKKEFSAFSFLVIVETILKNISGIIKWALAKKIYWKINFQYFSVLYLGRSSFIHTYFMFQLNFLVLGLLKYHNFFIFFSFETNKMILSAKVNIIFLCLAGIWYFRKGSMPTRVSLLKIWKSIGLLLRMSLFMWSKWGGLHPNGSTSWWKFIRDGFFANYGKGLKVLIILHFLI